MNCMWLNVSSILLGLCAWAAPLLYIVWGRQGGGRSVWPYTLSLGSCGTSLWFQILYNNHLATIEDVGALLDTMDTVAKVSGFLLITTVLLNFTVYLWERSIYRKGKGETL